MIYELRQMQINLEGSGAEKFVESQKWAMWRRKQVGGVDFLSPSRSSVTSEAAQSYEHPWPAALNL